MSVKGYIGVLEGSGDVGGVWLPDLPGCVGGGPTAAVATEDAVQALRLVATGMLADGGTLPPARDHVTIRQDPEVAEALLNGDVLVSLPLLLDRGRSVRANVSFDAGLLDAIDEAAKARGLTRSAFLSSAARDKIAAEA